MTLLLFVVGIALLVVGAELLVRGASFLAALCKISPLIIGLTVVAFGTGAPEMAVCVNSSIKGQTNIAIGNAVGSNIMNVLFILGMSAMIIPLTVSKQLTRLDVPFMIVVSIIVFVFAFDGKIGTLEGVFLVSMMLLYTIVLIRLGRKESQAKEGSQGEIMSASGRLGRSSGLAINIVFLLVGLGMLVLGSNWLVESAVAFARYLNVSESIIGLTIVAVGTSLPEIVTSIVASIKGQRDMAVGNVVGSNIFNLLGVVGVSAIVAPSGLEVLSSVIHFDLPVLLATAAVCLPIFFTGGKIARWEGAFLFGFYIAYTFYLLLAASHHDALEIYSIAILYFVIPLAILAIVASVWNAVKTGNH